MSIAAQYHQHGYVAPIDILNDNEVAHYRAALEDAEARLGSLHYEQNIHTQLRSAFELATNENILDAVEAIIGPDIRLYCATYI
ncbi:MAG: phytanoyl-CoA dioxygenase family protein, partial [Gammaproteobacteria bacterium]|nr:phytanoyl-CoA dioxygenase family protein [Gammaproteobacteria bacterium]MCP4880559.1 phytanoyl-CoA dioxygenase family protein [Gammaproteobacteria bacterium]